MKFNNIAGAKIRLSLANAETGKRHSFGRWHKNLFLDSGLNSLAMNLGGGQSGGLGLGFGGKLCTCLVGSGTNPNAINTGSAILTQAGNTVTAASSFFTTAMIGAILKYDTGTGGAEQYITAVPGGGLTCTVGGPGMTVATAKKGTVWMVQQTTLQTFLYKSQTYLNGSANNGQTLSSSSAVLFRTFTFPLQATSYSVNEIGYGNDNSGNDILGRIVPGSTTVVPPTDYLVIEIVMTITPGAVAPFSVSNVGTGIDTAGTAMFQNWVFRGVSSSGGPSPLGSGGGVMDAASGIYMLFNTGTAQTLNASIGSGTSTIVTTGYQVGAFGTLTLTAPGASNVQAAYNLTTAGETLTQLIFGAPSGSPNVYADLCLTFTTPFTLPVGSFSGIVYFSFIFTRTLTN